MQSSKSYNQNLKVDPGVKVESVQQNYIFKHEKTSRTIRLVLVLNGTNHVLV